MSHYDEWINEEEKQRIRALYPRIAKEMRVILVAQTCPESVHMALGVAELLKESGAEELLGPVLDMLKPGSRIDSETRSAALEILPSLDPDGSKSLETLSRDLNSKEDLVWASAAVALSKTPPMAGQIVAKIKQDYASMRYRQESALRALRQLGPLAVEATEFIVEQLTNDEHAEDAWQALEAVNPERAAALGVPPNLKLQRLVDDDFAEKTLNALGRGVPHEEVADEPQVAAHLDEPETILSQQMTADFLGSGRDFLATYGSDLKGSCQRFISELTDPELIKSAADKLADLADTGRYSEATAVECLLGCLEDVDDDFDVECSIVSALDAIVRLCRPTPPIRNLEDILK